MKKILLFILCLTMAVFSFAQNMLSKQEEKAVINCVKAYTDYMIAFSGNIENVYFLDSINALCENENIQTFNDLTNQSAIEKKSFRSVPLSQYLQDITLKFENNIEMKFSDYNCEQTLNEPVSTSDYTTFALVHVVKTIKANGINRTEKQKIIVNLCSMKIAGTVSEQYEDPLSIYLNALSMIRTKQYVQAQKLLDKCISYESFSGRYKAMVLIGNLYADQKLWDNAIEWYTKASEGNMIGALALANIYFGRDKKVPSKYINKQKAIDIYEKYTKELDKDQPQTTFAALTTLMAYYAQGEDNTQDKAKAWECVSKMEKFLGKKPSLDLEFLAVKAHILYYIYIKGYNSAATLITFARQNLHLYNSIVRTGYENILDDLQKDVVKYADVPVADNKADELVIEAKKCLADNKYGKAIEYYEKAAARGNAEAEYVMFLYNYPFSKNDALLTGQDLGNKSNPQNILQYIYYKAYNEKNKEIAITNLIKSAEQKYMDSQYMLGILCLIGKVDMDKEKGIELYLRAMDRDLYENSMNKYTILCSLLGEANQELIINKAKMICDDCGAANWIMTEYSKNQKDPQKELQYRNKGVRLGFIASIIDDYNVLMSQKKYGVAAIEANILSRKGYKKGYVMAGEAYGLQDKVSMERYSYKQGYEAKDPVSTYRLAICYHDGKGIDKDIKQAIDRMTSALEYAKDDSSLDTNSWQEMLAKWKGEADAAGISLTSASTPATVANTTYDMESEMSKINADMQKNLIAAQLVGIPRTSQLPGMPKEAVSKVIEQLEKNIQDQYFDSPKAEVKIVAVDGNTVIATKTVKDYMQELAVMTKVPTIKVLDMQNGSSGKVKQITIQVNE